MVRITKVYTRKGDEGFTRLAQGDLLSKDSLFFSVLGDLDELNAHIGVLTHYIDDSFLKSLQHILFDIGGYLSLNDASIALPINEKNIQSLENFIDNASKELGPLTSFILPGGTYGASFAHLARTVTRRVERAMVALHHVHPLPSLLLSFINRLSDYFFMLGRYDNHIHKVNEVLWKAEKPS